MSRNFGLGGSARPNFESSFLISQQKSLRLRHLSQIAACNLKAAIKCTDADEIQLQTDSTALAPEKYGYYFTLAIKLDSILYTSELSNDTSPCWLPFDFDNILAPAILSAKGCIVRIWFKNETKEDLLVLSWGVYFSGLVPIGKKFFNISPHVSPNTIVFRIKEMLYTSPDCRFRTELHEESRTKIPVYHTMSLPSSEVKAGCFVSSVCRLHSLQRSKYITQQRINELIRDLEDYGISATSDSNILLKKVERSRLKVSVLTERLEREISKYRSLRNVHDQLDTEVQEKSMLIFDQYHALNRDLNSFQKAEADIEGKMASLKDIVKQVHQRRMYLLRQLPIIFPITHDPINKDKMYICNVHLPEAEYYGDVKDSSLNVALGFVAQLLVAVSNFINIPLSFPITLFGSTSSITDWTTVQDQTRSSFPLHSRGRERIFFDYAVFLLNKNIAQLRWTCGLATRNLRPSLFNIWTLLNVISNPESPLNAPDVALKSPLKPISLDQILREGNNQNASDNNELPVGKSVWSKESRSNYSKKYEHRKAYNHSNAKKKCVNIVRSFSLDSGLHLLKKQEKSFLQLHLLRRTKSCSFIRIDSEKEQLNQDEYPTPVIQVQEQEPAYIDGLNESDRKIIDESFELVKNKYFLKRSNSLDRLTTLNAAVSIEQSRRSEDHEALKRLDDSQQVVSEIPDIPSEVSTEESKDSNVLPKEMPLEDNFSDVALPKDDPLLKVFSRTSALASQNFSFKYSNKRSDNS